MSGFTQLRPTLIRWTQPHPEWGPGAEPESPGDWPEEVGSVAYGARDGLVLIDPLLPDDPQAPLWRELDTRAAAHGDRVVVLTTIEFHRRSREAAIERYGASTTPPAGVRMIPIERAGEEMVWIEEHAALVPGDRLMSDGAGGLRLCPESWLGYLGNGLTADELRGALAPLLELPVEMVLVSHGDPVLGDAPAALRRVLA
jgi:hypothetical protein